MIKKYYEIFCDNCGYPNYLGYKPNKQDLIEMKWIFHNGKHFCCKECKEEYILNIMNMRFVIQHYKINEYIITYKMYNNEIINWYSRINKVTKNILRIDI